MDRWRLGVYDSEEFYARSLGHYIRDRSGGRMEVKIFTDMRALRECLDEEGLDGVLAGDDAAAACLEHPGIWKGILVEEERKREGWPSEIPVIGKYQSAEKIWSRLFQEGGAGAWEPAPSGREGWEMVGIASPILSCRRTALGLVLARSLAEAGRCLYAAMDAFSCLEEAVGECRDAGELSELYYYYCQGKLDGARLQAFTARWGGLDWIPPARRPEDLWNRGKPYEAKFFEGLAASGGYRYLVLDLGTASGRESLLERCSLLAVLVSENPWEQVRTERFFDWLAGLGFPDKRIWKVPEELFVEAGYGSMERAFSGREGVYVRESLRQMGRHPGGEGYGAGDQEALAVTAGAGRGCRG